jgi:hypothetical protein
MGEQSDYLELWIHYEDRGFDDKNRMISTASLLWRPNASRSAAILPRQGSMR